MPEHQKLSDFLIKLVKTDAEQKKYKTKGPSRYIEESDLSDAHKTLLKSGELSAIQREVDKERPGEGLKAMRIFAIW